MGSSGARTSLTSPRPLLPRLVEEDKNIWLMSYGVQQVHPQGGPAIAHCHPLSGMGDFAIRNAISVQLEFKLCHSGQDTTEEEEVAGLGVHPTLLRTEGLEKTRRICGSGISHRYVLAAGTQ